MSWMRGVHDARTGTDILDHDACLALASRAQVGRVAVVDGNQPLVFPVNYRLDGADVLFRTGPGTKLTMANRTVCFEVDEIDPATRSGWSVMIQGRLEEVSPADGPAFERVSGVEVDPWAASPKDHLMRVVARVVTGRRIPRGR